MENIQFKNMNKNLVLMKLISEKPTKYGAIFGLKKTKNLFTKKITDEIQVSRKRQLLIVFKIKIQPVYHQGSTVYAQFLINISDMIIDRAVGDIQSFGNFGILKSLRDQNGYLLFPLSQIIIHQRTL